jgi:hypothetical protein
MKIARVRRHTFQQFGCRRAVFRFRGRWRARRDHDLCPRCFRSVMDRLRAHLLVGLSGKSGGCLRAASLEAGSSFS